MFFRWIFFCFVFLDNSSSNSNFCLVWFVCLFVRRVYCCCCCYYHRLSFILFVYFKCFLFVCLCVCAFCIVSYSQTNHSQRMIHSFHFFLQLLFYLSSFKVSHTHIHTHKKKKENKTLMKWHNERMNVNSLFLFFFRINLMMINSRCYSTEDARRLSVLSSF